MSSKNNTPALTAEKTTRPYNRVKSTKGDREGLLKKTTSVVILLSLCLGAFAGIKYLGMNAAKKAYSDAFDDESQKAYDAIYQLAYNQTEASYHVSNRATIAIGPIKEKMSLETLSVDEVVYEQADESFFEVHGTGIFTVNLQTAEYIIDDDRSYILVRLPEPTLSEFTIRPEHTRKLIENGKWLSTPQTGVAIASDMLKRAENDIKASIMNNQQYYRYAKESAVSVLTKLIQKINRGVEDLTIEIEFMG